MISEVAKKAVEEIQAVCVDPKTPFLPHGAAEIIQKAMDKTWNDAIEAAITHAESSSESDFLDITNSLRVLKK